MTSACFVFSSPQTKSQSAAAARRRERAPCSTSPFVVFCTTRARRPVFRLITAPFVPDLRPGGAHKIHIARPWYLACDSENSFHLLGTIIELISLDRDEFDRLRRASSTHKSVCTLFCYLHHHMGLCPRHTPKQEPAGMWLVSSASGEFSARPGEIRDTT